MNHGELLRELLAPLGVYDLYASYNGGELDSQGRALDGVGAALDELHREADLTSAEDWGLEKISGLLSRRPVAASPQQMRRSLMALLRIGAASFTLEDINRAITGCGIRARVSETRKTGVVEVSFPDIPGIPDGFEEIARIIEDILPAHLAVEYVYWYVTWRELEERVANWQDIETRQLDWTGLETLVGE